MNSLSPFASFVHAAAALLCGRLHFDHSRVGEEFTDPDGQHFRVFRAVVLDPRPGQPAKPGAVFIPHFHVAGMTVRANILFSLLPMPFFLGLPGFRSKCWMVDDQSGDFSGYYEWDTLEDARAYASSFAARFMTARSIPDSVKMTVYPVDQAPSSPARRAARE